MKVGDKVQLRRRISQKGGKTRLATEKVTILGIYPHHVQVRNQKGIVRSYINWEWQGVIQFLEPNATGGASR